MNSVFWGGFGVGFGIAACAGLIANLIFRKKFKKKIVDVEVEKAVNKVLDQINKEENDKKKKEKIVKKEESETKKTTNINDLIGHYEGEKMSEYRVNYHVEYPDPAEMEGPEEDDVDEEECEKYDRMVKNDQLITDENRDEIEAEELNNEMHSGKKPKLITSESYDNDYLNFDKVQLAYYMGDGSGNGCLVDVEANEEIFDEELIVGDCLDKYGFRVNDELVIYVRNFSMGADYEISKLSGVWQM